MKVTGEFAGGLFAPFAGGQCSALEGGFLRALRGLMVQRGMLMPVKGYSLLQKENTLCSPSPVWRTESPVQRPSGAAGPALGGEQREKPSGISRKANLSMKRIG